MLACRNILRITTVSLILPFLHKKLNWGIGQTWTTKKGYVVLMSSRKGKGFILK